MDMMTEIPSRDPQDYPQRPVERKVKHQYPEQINGELFVTKQVTEVAETREVDIEAIPYSTIERMREVLSSRFHVNAITPRQVFYAYMSMHWAKRGGLIEDRVKRTSRVPEVYTSEHDYFRIQAFSTLAFCFECNAVVPHASSQPRHWCDGCFDREFVIEHGLSKLHDIYGEDWFRQTDLNDNQTYEWVGVSVGSLMAFVRSRLWKRKVDPTEKIKRHEYRVPPIQRGETV